MRKVFCFDFADKCFNDNSPLILIIKRDDERKILNDNLLLDTLIQDGFSNTHVSNENLLLDTLIQEGFTNTHVSNENLLLDTL